MNQNKENTNAFLIHFSALLGFLFPFGSIISPLIAWQTLKERSSFLDRHGKEAINFNVSYSLYIFIITIFLCPFIFFSLSNNFNNYSYLFRIDSFSAFSIGSLAGIINIIKIALIITVALKAKEGKNYKYPFTIKFIK